ncbi:hypothetical protein DYB37_006981 [Aphanomyces astaci]|uniref:Major facilitator superfamily associated domain-containing protein n=1 Tax=Aphanomyces astaci TaxID=112090 RepID=A0A3R6ZY63_APHAT|nr:hypothetical protein DYB35_006200 [Aphanomyces astaci]RHZ04242.1 hypothetical protein DYB37_006981 [Aphanomyces astaci]
MQVQVQDDVLPAQVEQSPLSAYSHVEEGSLGEDDRDHQLLESIRHPWYWRLFHIADGTATIVDTDGRKTRRTRSSANSLEHPIVASLVLQFPWIGLSLLYFSVFELMTSYLTSRGVHYFVPRYMRAFLTFALAPLVGAASDRCTAKAGRRNRFLMLATFKLVISVMFLGGSLSIFGDHLFLLSINIAVIIWGTVSMEVAVRARVFDEIPKEYQVHAHACGSIWHSVGVALGMVLVGGGAKVVYGDQITEDVMLFTCGIVVTAILVTVGVSMYLKPEKMLYQERKHVVSVERFFTEVWDVITGAPMEIKLMCLLQLIVWMAWFALDNQKYKWWAETVFRGCPVLQSNATSADGVGCDGHGVDLYMEGLDMARHAVQGLSAIAFMSTLTFFWWIPRNPTGASLKQVNLTYMTLGVVMLVVAVAVGPASPVVSFIAFVSLGGYFATVNILPFAMVHFMDATDRFNNNGLYVGLLMQFSCCAKFAVENYNTTSISSLGN